MTNIELAKWLHDNYEAVAKEKDWNTQQSCKVEFDTLPDANKRTMIEIADRLLNFNLLRLHFVVGQSEQLPCDRCENGLIWSKDRLKAKSCDCGK
jgi:hypothetical protein